MTEKKDKPMNIYQKMIEVRKSCEFLQKGATGYKYKYVTESQVLFAVRKAFDEQGLFLQIGMENTDNTRLGVVVTVINAEDPADRIIETIYYDAGNVTTTETEGVNDRTGENYTKTVVDTDPRITGSLLTYSLRYFLLKNLMIATDEADLDTVQKKSLSAQTTTKALLSTEQVDSIESLCKGRKDIIDKIVKHAPAGKLKNLQGDRYQGILNFAMSEIAKKEGSK